MLEVTHIRKIYHKRTVLDGVGFTLRPGECLGVAGHNGSGKSTLLSIVAQVTPPDAGSIACEGRNVLGDRDFMRRMVGYVPQQNALLHDLTVWETLRFWQRAYGLAEADLFAPGGPCAMLGLEKLKKKRVGTLSGGMQKRLSVALALLHSPRYLLLDEALPALDRHYRAALLDWLGVCRRAGTALLYCSHEVDELRDFCDSILVLRQGVPVFYDTAAHLPRDGDTLDAWMNPAEPN